MFHIRFSTARGMSLHAAQILNAFSEPRRLGHSFVMEDAVLPGHPQRRVTFNNGSVMAVEGPAIMDSRRILAAEF